MSTVINPLQQIKGSTRRFGELMDLYEDNYVRFRKLVGQLDELEGENCSICFNDMTLYLRVIQRSRYTTTVLLTYLLAVEARQPVRIPDLKVRIYHDAHQAEVMSCCCNHPDTSQWLEKDASQSTIQWRWRINRFLYKWLNYCLKSGHGFPQEEPATGWTGCFSSIGIAVKE